MADLLYIGVVVVAFGVLGAFCWACEALRKEQ